MAYQVIIIEDDPMVAAIDRQYVETDSRFQVAHVLKSGGEALGVLEHCRPDLIILDYYTPSMDGMEFVDRLHAMGQYPAIIMVTSANDREIVQGLLSRGVLDYLVKPFAFARFRQAMDKFLQAQNLLSCPQESSLLDQQAIDRLIRRQEHPEPGGNQMSKGLNAAGAQLSLRQPRTGAHQRGDRRTGPPVPHHHPAVCELYGGDRGAGQLHRLPDWRPALHPLQLHRADL